MHGGPEAETALWLDKLAEVNRKRACYHEMAAVDLIGFDELRARIAELEETRAAAERELRALDRRREQMRQLERGTRNPCSTITQECCRTPSTAWTRLNATGCIKCSG